MCVVFQPEEVRDRLLHFVVVGGGPTGVECAAELHDFVIGEVARFFPELKDKFVLFRGQH